MGMKRSDTGGKGAEVGCLKSIPCGFEPVSEILSSEDQAGHEGFLCFKSLDIEGLGACSNPGRSYLRGAGKSFQLRVMGEMCIPYFVGDF